LLDFGDPVTTDFNELDHPKNNQLIAAGFLSMLSLLLRFSLAIYEAKHEWI
jgi:hypothetical protein